MEGAWSQGAIPKSCPLSFLGGGSEGQLSEED